MKKHVRSLWSLSVLALFLSVGIALNAQDTTPPTQTPDASQSQTPQAQQPSQQTPPASTPDSATPDRSAQPAPDSQAPSAQATQGQSFTGTIVKSGDKYVFQDAASGNTYDIDHQDEVQKFEGKKVKVHGTLDPSGKMIHVQ